MAETINHAQRQGEIPAQVAPAPPQRPENQVDDSKLVALYSNFCRVTGTPEELILDFGMNPSPFQALTHPIPVTQRIITSFETAKRMLHVLQLCIERHESAFGAVETDVQRRVLQTGPRQ